MQQKVANYTVIIEKQKRAGTRRYCYVASVPALGIATDEDKLEDVEKSIKALIQFHLKSLKEEGESIPIEAQPAFVTRFEVFLPSGATLVTL